MVTPPKTNAMAKVAMATMCVSISCSALADAFPEKKGCEVINHTNYEQFLEKRSDVKVMNPFKPETCVLLDYNSDYKNKLSVDDFNGNKEILSYFESFQERSRTRVEMVMDYENKQLYTLLQFNTKEASVRGFKKLASGKDIAVFMDEFLFLHEMTHFEPSITLNKGYSMAKREMMSDITALIMLKSKHDLSMSEFFELTSSVFELRKEEHKLVLRQERNDKRRKQSGDHYHYDEDLAKNIEKFLSFIKDNGIDMRVTSLNEAKEVAMHMMHNYQGSEMIDLAKKTMTIKNDPYRQAFFSMQPGEQMVYYENNKALMSGELLAMFEDFDTLLPADQEKLDHVSPEIIQDASQFFNPEIKDVAQQYLATVNYGNDIQMTASVSIDPSINLNAENNQEKVQVNASGLRR